MSESANPRVPLRTLLIFLLSLAATLAFFFLRDIHVGAESVFVLAAATLISLIIWQACDPFADAAQWVGIRLKLPSSVRGATLDAIASSMPELFAGLFFVTLALTGDKTDLERLQASADGYGSTIATCAGSSIYNMILIPAVCGIAISYSRKTKPFISVSREVLSREGSWVLLTQFGLLIFLFQPKLHWWMAIVAFAAYLFYVLHLYFDTWKFRRSAAVRQLDPPEQEGSSTRLIFGMIEVPLRGLTAFWILVVSTLVAALACYFLVELTRDAAHRLNVPEFFVAVVLTAAVSSIPDTFVSLGSARRGDDSGAMSNVFGSNIFDICIGMSIPLIVGCYLNQWQPIVLVDENDQTLRGVIGLRVFLFVLTVIALGVMWRLKKISRRTGWFFALMYTTFVLYAILGALDVIPA